MVCLLRLQLELSVQARALLMARQAGLDLPVDDDLADALAEMKFLRGSIGTTGLLALRPLQVSTHGAEFHRHVLEQAQNQETVGSGHRCTGSRVHGFTGRQGELEVLVARCRENDTTNSSFRVGSRYVPTSRSASGS